MSATKLLSTVSPTDAFESEVLSLRDMMHRYLIDSARVKLSMRQQQSGVLTTPSGDEETEAAPPLEASPSAAQEVPESTTAVPQISSLEIARRVLPLQLALQREMAEAETARRALEVALRKGTALQDKEQP